VDYLGSVEIIDGLGQGVVIAVPHAAHRRLDACLGKALSIPDRDVLAAPVAVVDQTATMDWAPVMDRLFQGIQHEAGMRRPARPPAYDIAGVDVDHEGDIDEPRPGRDVGGVRDPQHVRRRGMELAVDLIERARRGLVADRRLHRLAPDHALQAEITYQPLDRAAGKVETFTLHLPPDFPRAVGAEVLGEHAQHFGLERLVGLSAS